MKVKQIKAFDRDDFKEAPEWFIRFLDVLNQSITNSTSCFQRRVNFDDNIQCRIKEILFTSGTEQIISHDLDTKYRGMLIFSSTNEISGRYDRNVDATRIGVTISFKDGNPGKVTFAILG